MKDRISNFTRAGIFTIALLAILGLSHRALATAPKYDFQQINVPGSAHTGAFGINDHGDIVGTYDAGGSLPVGFLLRKGIFTTIMVPGSILTVARGINNAGHIVGDFLDAAFTQHAFLLREGQFTVIDFPGAVGTLHSGINVRGDIVAGYFTSDNPDIAHGFLLTHRGKFEVIAYPGAVESGPVAINARGDMVGVWDNDIFFNFHGFILRDGDFVTLDYPGAIGELGGSNPSGINSRGQIAGDFVDANGGHGYVWHDGVFTPIDAPAGVLGTTGVNGINDRGQIVGKYKDAKLGHRVGFVAAPVRQEDDEESNE